MRSLQRKRTPVLQRLHCAVCREPGVWIRKSGNRQGDQKAQFGTQVLRGKRLQFWLSRGAIGTGPAAQNMAKIFGNADKGPARACGSRRQPGHVPQVWIPGRSCCHAKHFRVSRRKLPFCLLSKMRQASAHSTAMRGGLGAESKRRGTSQDRGGTERGQDEDLPQVPQKIYQIGWMQQNDVRLWRENVLRLSKSAEPSRKASLRTLLSGSTLRPQVVWQVPIVHQGRGRRCPGDARGGDCRQGRIRTKTRRGGSRRTETERR
mmetsp:Transcript_14626/g.36785  ORF Transcript_14626/g.36785 Transcript_14626/m.36785 type:complete len:262 (-) Transcript_14626:180-965(-)